MTFILEALEAKKGDSLLLHYGTAKNPKLIVIDGGPAGVYKSSLQPRLEEIRKERTPGGTLPIRMVMVSHLDDDHINGILAMTGDLSKAASAKRPLPYGITTLWHNSFNDVLGDEGKELTTGGLKTAVLASSSPSFNSNMPIKKETALVLASVEQGRKLRDAAAKLGLLVNEMGVKNRKGKLMVMVPEGADSLECDVGDGLKFTVIGPDGDRLKDLQKEWDEQIKKSGVATATLAAFADKSVFNLSSISLLATYKKKTILLTGDARGDYLRDGLRRARLLKKDGTFHVDILKLPHHGSDRNVETSFFRDVTADHYVVSGDGEHGNPEVATFQMIAEARKDDNFTIHLTNGVLPKEKKPADTKKLLEYFAKEKKAGRKFKVNIRKDTKLSVQVDLGV